MLFKELVSSNSTFIFNTHSVSGEALLSVKVNDILENYEIFMKILRSYFLTVI